MATEVLTAEQVAKDFEFIFNGLPESIKDEIAAGIIDNAKLSLNPSLNFPNIDEATMRDSLSSAFDPNFVMNRTDDVYKSGKGDMEVLYTVRLSNGSMVYLKRTNYEEVNNLVVRFYSNSEADVDRVVVEVFYYVDKKKSAYTTTVQRFLN